MKRFILVMGLLCAVAFPCYAQNWTPQDSLRLNRLLKGEGEVGKTESGGIAGIGNEQFSGYSESGDGQVVDGF